MKSIIAVFIGLILLAISYSLSQMPVIPISWLGLIPFFALLGVISIALGITLAVYGRIKKK